MQQKKIKNRFVKLVTDVIARDAIFLKAFVEYFLSTILLSKSESTESSERILLINTEKLGDLVMSFDFINSIVQKYPSSALICRREYKELLARSFENLEVIPIELKNYKINLSYKRNFITRISKTDYKRVINLTPERGIINDELVRFTYSSSKIALKSRTPYIPKTVLNRTNKFYHQFVDSKEYNEHKVLEDAIRSLDLKSNLDKKIYIEKSILKKFSLHEKAYIAVGPSSSMEGRDLPLGMYKELIRALAEENIVVLLGTDEQRQKYDKNFTHKNILNLAGNTAVLELPTILQYSKLFIGNDSGLTHIANYLGIRTIAIIGGGKFKKFFPYRENKNIHYFYKYLECFGCGNKCIYKQPYCVTEINVNELIGRSKELLKEIN